MLVNAIPLSTLAHSKRLLHICILGLLHVLVYTSKSVTGNMARQPWVVLLLLRACVREFFMVNITCGALPFFNTGGSLAADG
jgi:hypothetical protein